MTLIGILLTLLLTIDYNYYFDLIYLKGKETEHRPFSKASQ